MIPKGYTIIARNYVAEIVEFQTLEIIQTPDEGLLYHIATKYGEDYVAEGQIKPIRKMLEKECEELNKALEASRGTHIERSYNKIH